MPKLRNFMAFHMHAGVTYLNSGFYGILNGCGKGNTMDFVLRRCMTIISVIKLSKLYPPNCRDADTTKERIEKLLKAGADVVLTTKGIDDMVYGFEG